MSSVLPTVPNNTQVIESYRGNGFPQDCSINYIKNREELIKQKFSEMGWFRKAAPIDQSLIYLKCMKLNYLEIVKSIVTGAFLGSVIGGLAGTTANAPGAATGAAIGAGIGSAAGVYWCYHKGLYNKEEHIVSVVKDTTEYSQWKKQRTKEEYELFVAFLQNYGALVDSKYENRILDFVCSINLEIPEYPVFSPYDIERKNPYEKEAIEAYLDKMKPIVEKQVQEYESECARLRIPIDPQNIFQIRRQYCPLRTGYYTKEELVYDPDYVHVVIETLKGIQQELKGNVPKNKDPVILKAIDSLIVHYSQNNDVVLKKLIKAMAKDIFAIDGDIELANGASKKLKKFLVKA